MSCLSPEGAGKDLPIRVQVGAISSNIATVRFSYDPPVITSFTINNNSNSYNYRANALGIDYHMHFFDFVFVFDFDFDLCFFDFVFV